MLAAEGEGGASALPFSLFRSLASTNWAYRRHDHVYGTLTYNQSGVFAETRGPRPTSATSANADSVARAWVAATNAGDVESIVSLFGLPARVRISAADPYDELTTKAELRTWVDDTSEQLWPCRHDIQSVGVDARSVTLVVTLTPLSGECPFEQGREITIAREVVGREDQDAGLVAFRVSNRKRVLQGGYVRGRLQIRQWRRDAVAHGLNTPCDYVGVANA